MEEEYYLKATTCWGCYYNKHKLVPVGNGGFVPVSICINTESCFFGEFLDKDEWTTSIEEMGCDLC